MKVRVRGRGRVRVKIRVKIRVRVRGSEMRSLQKVIEAPPGHLVKHKNRVAKQTALRYSIM